MLYLKHRKGKGKSMKKLFALVCISGMLCTLILSSGAFTDTTKKADISDALEVLKHLVKIQELPIEQIDFDGDGEITILDALTVLKSLAGMSEPIILPLGNRNRCNNSGYCDNIGGYCDNVGGYCNNVGGYCDNVGGYCDNTGGYCDNIGGRCNNTGERCNNASSNRSGHGGGRHNRVHR